MPGKDMDGDTLCSTENSLNFSSSKFIWDQRGRDRNEKIISPYTGMEFYLKWKSLNLGVSLHNLTFRNDLHYKIRQNNLNATLILTF